MRKIFVLVGLLVAYILSASAQNAKTSVIAYYTGDENEINSYPVAKLTHVIYSFAHLRGDTLAFTREGQGKILESLVALKKKFPGLKVMVALGGWGGCKTCSPVFADAASREKFAKSVVRFLKQYKADGLDIDWEYPGIEGHPDHPWMPEDRENFTSLLQSIRSHMGKHYELSFAAGGFRKFLEQSIEWEKVIPLVDRVNLMTYDLVNGYSTVTGHHTGLFGNQNLPEATSNCVEYLLNHGVPANKLVIGAAFYARVWKDVPDVNHGLYQQGIFKNSVSYKSFQSSFTTDNGFENYWDDSVKAPFSYSSGRKEFATYDDERSIEAKVKYLKEKKLGGIMFWELTLDKNSGGLLDKIYDEIYK